MKCETATRLASDSLERRLTWSEKTGLKSHMMICTACRRFNININELRNVVREHQQRDDSTAGDNATD